MDEVRLPMEEQAEHLHRLTEMFSDINKKYDYDFTSVVYGYMKQIRSIQPLELGNIKNLRNLLRMGVNSR